MPTAFSIWSSRGVSFTSSFYCSINSIVFGSPNKQMFRIYTSRIITSVANKLSSWISSVKDNAKSMSTPVLAFKLKEAIAILVRASLEFPATVFFLFNAVKKVLFGISFYIVCFGHNNNYSRYLGRSQCP